ncbi:3-oxoadipate enol-lactonase [Salaquimonas pukyongi]|uniref:3-oxoadipate enol-lactonase n=1 Tax=Salaquimonas pukyongi TaxID=2712698 RepID=UPI00096BB981|nr:3-oxoadipate enol-lactonase [Salaquimonas pukyongi]
MQFAELNGVTLHYQTIGAAKDKPLIVFINSLGTDFRIWRDVIVELAGNAAILTYDKRGHGLSSLGSPPYSMGDHVEDLIALLDYLAVKPAVLCGVSVGGMIAQGVYAKRPDLVASMILCDTGHKIGTKEMWDERIKKVTEDGIAVLAEPILERWFTADFRKSRTGELEGYRNMLTRQPAEGYAGTCVAIRDADFTQDAANIAVPALCVVGAEDGATPPALVEELAGLIPDAGFEVIGEAGHLPSIDQPKKLAGLIKGFLTANAAAQAEGDGGSLH